MLRQVLKYLIMASLCLSWPAFAKGIDVKTYIPIRAYQYLPILKQELLVYFPTFPEPAYFGGLIEQESCWSLTHSRCWNPEVTLNKPREYGAGLTQITKAFNKNGSVRFDTLEELRRQHVRELKELSWDTILKRPDLQLRATMLGSRENYKKLYFIPDTFQRIAFMDAAWNGGLGGVYRDRRLCGLTSKCDPNIWFENVEKTCSKSKNALYGNRSPCFINREHVYNVMYLRYPKYKPYF